MKPVSVGINLKLQDVIAVARFGARVKLNPKSKSKIKKSRSYVEQLVKENQVVYGITTGFGKLASTRIEPKDVQTLQRNLILSHAMGVGEPLSTEVVRAMLLLRAQSLSFGYSGIRLQVIELILECLNHGIHPIIPSQGSVGASGDLAPLSHMALTFIGEGKAEYQGSILSSRKALEKAGLKACCVRG